MGALALLGGIVALFAARRRKTTKFEDSIISGTDIKTNTVFGSTGGGVVNTGDNSLASDFSREGLGNIDTDEVDPIAEAEVYLAYGRDAQAEEILKDALKKDPQRQEIYLKLLEIHAQHNKPSAFETVASELYSVTNGQGEVWQKAVALGRQLDPDQSDVRRRRRACAACRVAAPHGRSAEGSADRGSARRTGLEFQMDEEISISPTSARSRSRPRTFSPARRSELEKTARLRRDGFRSRTSTMALPAAGVAAAAAAGAAAAAKATQASLHDKVESVSRQGNRRRGQVRSRLPSRRGREAGADGQGARRAGAGNRGVQVRPRGAAPAQLARPAAALELDKLDLSFDPERSTFEDPTPSVLDGQWHDAATKLDLAKAYQEMGDVEGAREILQEVLHEGDDQQKAEAKSLLAKLG